MLKYVSLFYSESYRVILTWALQAPGDLELKVDYWELISAAPGGEENYSVLVSENADTYTDALLQIRHLVIRGETASAILKCRAATMKAFRDHYHDRSYTEVTPPLMVQTQCEGGSTLFNMDYYGQSVPLSRRYRLLCRDDSQGNRPT